MGLNFAEINSLVENSKQQSRLPKFMQQLRFPGNLRRLIIVFLLVIALIFILFPKPVTLSFVVSKNEVEYWRPLIDQFEAKNKSIRIDLANLSKTKPVNPADTDRLKATYIEGFEGKSQPFDLIYMDIIWVPEFAEAGWLVDLTKELSQQEFKKLELNEFLVSEVDNGYYNGKLYRIPFRTDVGVLYYRKDLLKEAGYSPPETFEDLIKISQALQKQKKVPWGYLWQGRQTEALAAMFVEVLKGYGGFWIKDKTVGLGQPAAIQAVEFLRSTMKQGISPEGITTYEEEYTRRLFRDGQAVFMRNWPFAWTYASSPGSSVRGKIAIKPMVHALGESSGACKGGWGFGIAKTTKHKKAALQAIKFFTSAAVQRQFTLAYGSVPSRRKLFFEPKIVARYSHYPELLNVIDKSWVARPRIPQYAQASAILQKYLGAALNPDENGYPSPQEAMNAAAQETQELLKDM